MILFFQVPQCHSDYVSTHTALSDHSCHHQQGRPQAQTGAKGSGESHPAGIRHDTLVLYLWHDLLCICLHDKIDLKIKIKVYNIYGGYLTMGIFMSHVVF